MEATKSLPDVVTSRGIDDFSLAEKEDYESLQNIYLTKQLRTGSGAELPGNMTLRKIVKPPKIHHRLELKKKLDILAKHGHHGERYRLLQLLRDFETKPSQFDGNTPTDLLPGLLAGNEDVAEVIHIRDDESTKKINALPINNKVIHLNSTMTTKKKHPKEYTQQDVTDFLSAIGLGHKSKEFEYNAVDGSMLATLTPEDFKNELGFTKLQTRKFTISYQQLIDDCASSSSMKNSSSNSSSNNDPTKMKDNVNGVMRCDLDREREYDDDDDNDEEGDNDGRICRICGEGDVFESSSASGNNNINILCCFYPAKSYGPNFIGGDDIDCVHFNCGDKLSHNSKWSVISFNVIKTFHGTYVVLYLRSTAIYNLPEYIYIYIYINIRTLTYIHMRFILFCFGIMIRTKQNCEGGNINDTHSDRTTMVRE